MKKIIHRRIQVKVEFDIEGDTEEAVQEMITLALR